MHWLAAWFLGAFGVVIGTLIYVKHADAIDPPEKEWAGTTDDVTDEDWLAWLEELEADDS